MAEVDNPFWRFSWELYHRPGVAEACLALQEAHGVDVNLVLYCCWAGRCGRALTAEDMAAAAGATAAWHRRVVRPLREVRRWLKEQAVVPVDEAADLRSEVKAQELEAERLEQAILHRTLPLGEAAPSPAAAVENLARYLDHRGVEPGISDAAHLAAVLAAAFAATLRPLDAVWLVEGRLQR